MTKKLVSPDAMQELLRRRFTNQYQSWVAGDGIWPMSIPLGVPLEKDAAAQPGAVRLWAEAWALWTGTGQVVWETRRWARMGTQRLPAFLSFEGPADVAAAIGQSRHSKAAVDRHGRL